MEINKNVLSQHARRLVYRAMGDMEHELIAWAFECGESMAIARATSKASMAAGNSISAVVKDEIKLRINGGERGGT
jgi:hypothetical protein